MREAIVIVVLIILAMGFTGWVFDDQHGHCEVLYGQLYICGEGR